MLIVSFDQGGRSPVVDGETVDDIPLWWIYSKRASEMH
jgi:hypothetical protein